MSTASSPSPQKRGRVGQYFQNLKDSYTISRRTYPWIGWALIGVLVVLVVLSVLLAAATHQAAWYWVLMGVLLAGMLDMILLSWTVRRASYTQIEGMDQCCGFGGTFSFKNADTSGAMVADKVMHIEKTGASVCAGGDVSCLMNIGGALSRKKSDVRTLHFAEILASTKESPLKIDGPVSLSIAGGK